METKFYHCPICGNLMLVLADSGLPPICCGQEMNVVVPNSTDGKVEAHVPKVTCQKVGCGDQKFCVDVKVGSMPHPMTPDHHINFVLMATDHSVQLKYLDLAKSSPEAHFVSCAVPREVISYCNLHGAWRIRPVACDK